MPRLIEPFLSGMIDESFDLTVQIKMSHDLGISVIQIDISIAMKMVKMG